MTKGNVVVRKLTEDDHAAWLLLWGGYLTFYKSALPNEITALTWSRLMEDETIHGWCAVLDGKVIGICHALEHGSSWSVAPYVYLEDLFVDPEIRNSGAGRVLIEAVYAHADKIGSSKVYWQTDFTNETARKLYDKIGEQSGAMVYQRKRESL